MRAVRERRADALKGADDVPETPSVPTPQDPKSTERGLAFEPEHRLTRRADFTRIYGAGRKAYGRHVTIFTLQRTETGEGVPPWRVGITATRKSGKAVERNRQRRRIREFFRLHQHELPAGWDFVVNTRRSLSEAGWREFREDMEQVLKRLGFRPASEAGARR